MDKRLKYKLQHHKNPRGEHRKKIVRYTTQHIFTNMFPRARNIKVRINEWDFIKIKNFCMATDNISKMKREPIL